MFEYEYICRSRTRRARGVAEAEMRQKQSRDLSRKMRSDQRPEQREQSAGRDETLSAGRDEMQSAGRDKKLLERETQSESENTSNDSPMLELVRRDLLYRESTQLPRGVARGERSPRARQRVP